MTEFQHESSEVLKDIGSFESDTFSWFYLLLCITICESLKLIILFFLFKLCAFNQLQNKFHLTDGHNKN